MAVSRLGRTIIGAVVGLAATQVAAAQDAPACDAEVSSTAFWQNDRPAKQMARGWFALIDNDPNDLAEVSAKVLEDARALNDYNLSYFPEVIREIADERHLQAWESVGNGRFFEDASVSQAELKDIAESVGEKPFPSALYQAAATRAVEAGSWSGFMHIIGEVRDQELSVVKAALAPVLNCRAVVSYGARPALER